jgi:hypothetical protein
MKNLCPIVFLTTIALVGCSSKTTSTTAPSPQMIKYCRDHMLISPDAQITPLGFFLDPGKDARDAVVVCFKFASTTIDPGAIFDATKIDATQFRTKFPPENLAFGPNHGWWDVKSQSLTGASFSFVFPGTENAQPPVFVTQRIWYTDDENGTRTYYIAQERK